MFKWIKALFASRPPRPTQPGRTLIHFQCDGCMATDWREIQRGEIIGRTSRVLYGSPRPVDFILARRADGVVFECFAVDCMPGQEYMQKNTENPDESLVGKMVYLR